jgi:hypothetical protein
MAEKTGEGGGAARRPGGAKPPRLRRAVRAGALVGGPLGEAVARRGFAEPDLLMRWDAVMGPHLAALCRPLRVRYGSSRRMGATLVVAADGARATEIGHLEPQILERANQLYGYRAVTRLRIEHDGGAGTEAAPPGLAETAAPFDGAGAPARSGQARPVPADRARAEARTGAIRDPALRETLTRLGAAVYARARRRDAPSES